MKTVNVVAAIIRDGNKIFATQRGYGEFKDGWEFPGGKVEAGETPQESEMIPDSAESGSDQKTVQRDDQQDAEQVEVGDAVDYKEKFEELEEISFFNQKK